AERFLQLAVGLPLGFVCRTRGRHFQDHDLVAIAAAAHPGQPAPAQAQPAPGIRIRRDLDLHRAAERGHFHRRAKRGLPRRDLQRVDDVVAVNLEARMGGVFDLQQQVARQALGPAALSLEPDYLPRAHSLGHLHLEGAAVEADAHAGTGVHRLQRHRQPGPGVAARICPAAGLRPGPAAAAAPDQLLEEIADAPAGAAAGDYLLEIEPRRPAVPEAAVRGTHLVPRAVAAGAQLVVRRALGGITQGLVGLVDGLELLFRARLLAHVRVVLARQPAVGGLDLGLAGARVDPERIVVVLELHRSPGVVGMPRGRPNKNGLQAGLQAVV